MKKLAGTTKQIAWANDIRSDMIRWYDLAIAEIDEDIADEDNAPEDIEKLTERREQLVAGFSRIIDSIDSASWWIDHRCEDPARAAGIMYKPSYLATVQQFVKRGVRVI